VKTQICFDEAAFSVVCRLAFYWYFYLLEMCGFPLGPIFAVRA